MTNSSRKPGFTLIEMIATIVILATLGTVVSSVIFRAVADFGTQATGAQVQADLATAMARVTRELAEIPLKSGGGTKPDISTLTASSITLGSGKSFTLSGTQLVFADSSGSATLLDGVTTFAVAAFDESNAALAATLSGSGCDTVRRLSITITVTRNGVTDTLRTRVFLRSTMSGSFT